MFIKPTITTELQVATRISYPYIVFKSLFVLAETTQGPLALPSLR